MIPTDEAHLPHWDPDAAAETYDLFHGQWLLDRAGHAAAPVRVRPRLHDVGADHRAPRRRRTARGDLVHGDQHRRSRRVDGRAGLRRAAVERTPVRSAASSGSGG
ncbi:MAG: hypothetical protein R2690_11210 [Acidimicrobiales bacterium]